MAFAPQDTGALTEDSCMSIEATKLIIRGAVAENGIEEQFNRHLSDFRKDYEDVKVLGDSEIAAYMLALSYFAAENQ
jgi:hypothetical protein